MITRDPIFRGEPEAAFDVEGDGFRLPAVWLARHYVPPFLEKRGYQIKLLGVLGHHTDSKTVKRLPARGGIRDAMKKGRKKLLVPSSGNFLSAAHDEAKGTEIELIGSVSSTLPSGKRFALERRGIELLTEKDLAAQLQISEPKTAMELIHLYSEKVGIPILDQYDCEWNGPWYEFIGEECWNKTNGQISAVVTTVGTKGKYNGVVGALKKKNSKIKGVIAYPYPGEDFPGARDPFRILEVKNKFVVEPDYTTLTDHIVVYARSAELHLEGISAGITFGAELATAQHYLLEMLVADRLEELRCEDGSIVVLLVSSDMIFPYISEGKRLFPHLYGAIVDPYQ